MLAQGGPQSEPWRRLRLETGDVLGDALDFASNRLSALVHEAKLTSAGPALRLPLPDERRGAQPKRSHKSSSVHPPDKTKHKVQNWAEYEKGLRDRGDVARGGGGIAPSSSRNPL